MVRVQDGRTGMSDADRVLAALSDGASILQPDLAYLLDLDIRTIQAALQVLRLLGYPIISGSDGVRLATTAAETMACAQALRRRAITQWMTARALRWTARRMQMAEDAASGGTLWEVS